MYIHIYIYICVRASHLGALGPDPRLVRNRAWQQTRLQKSVARAWERHGKIVDKTRQSIAKYDKTPSVDMFRKNTARAWQEQLFSMANAWQGRCRPGQLGADPKQRKKNERHMMIIITILIAILITK